MYSRFALRAKKLLKNDTSSQYGYKLFRLFIMKIGCDAKDNYLYIIYAVSVIMLHSFSLNSSS